MNTIREIKEVTALALLILVLIAAFLFIVLNPIWMLMILDPLSFAYKLSVIVWLAFMCSIVLVAIAVSVRSEIKNGYYFM